MSHDRWGLLSLKWFKSSIRRKEQKQIEIVTVAMSPYVY